MARKRPSKPIKSREKVLDIQDYLKYKNERNYILFLIGVTTGYRAGDLVKLKEKTGINIFIATGGTLARKVIIENKPKAVIAVACERDLTSGIQDMKYIPVLGIFNKRPNGPCVDTFIDIHEVEDAINFLTNKK